MVPGFPVLELLMGEWSRPETSTPIQTSMCDLTNNMVTHFQLILLFIILSLARCYLLFTAFLFIMKQVAGSSKDTQRDALIECTQRYSAHLEAMQAAKKAFKEKLATTADIVALRTQMKTETMAYKAAQTEMHKLSEELSQR